MPHTELTYAIDRKKTIQKIQLHDSILTILEKIEATNEVKPYQYNKLAYYLKQGLLVHEAKSEVLEVLKNNAIRSIKTTKKGLTTPYEMALRVNCYVSLASGLTYSCYGKASTYWAYQYLGRVNEATK